MFKIFLYQFFPPACLGASCVVCRCRLFTWTWFCLAYRLSVAPHRTTQKRFWRNIFEINTHIYLLHIKPPASFHLDMINKDNKNGNSLSDCTLVVSLLWKYLKSQHIVRGLMKISIWRSRFIKILKIILFCLNPYFAVLQSLLLG